MPRSIRAGVAALALTITSMLAVPTGAGAATNNADYIKAHRQTVKLAEGLQSYDLRGTMTMSRNTKSQTGGMSMEAELVAAARWPDRLFSSQSGEMLNLNLGTGPQQSWFLLGQLGNAYLGAPVQLTRDLATANEKDLTADKIFNFYGGIGQFLLPADLAVAAETGSATVEVDGREVVCQVFTTTGAQKTAADGQPLEGPRVIHYDPESGLVLKSELTIVFRRNGQEFAQKLGFALDEFALNGEVEEARFRFDVPAGTRIVNDLDLLTNPDAMTGQPAPDITFTDLEGQSLRLSDLRGQPVFIDFWATWCPPCKKEMPHIETLYQELGKSGAIRIIAASSEDPATIRKFLDRKPYSFPIVTVADTDAHTKYKATSIPAGFVIDADGVIRAHMVGAQTEAQLRAAFAKAGVK